LKNDIFSINEITPVISDIAEVAGLLWEKGWAERNAGNMSVNVSDLDTGFPDPGLEVTREVLLEKAYPGLSGKLFILTGTGTRMRDIAKNPAPHLCLIKINESGSGYCQFSRHPGSQNPYPTSELATHLAIHEMLLRNKPDMKAVVHAHATELIALTHISEYRTEEKINHLLWGMHPEAFTFVPEGIGLVPYSLPGTEDIAEVTGIALQAHSALVWEKHGVISTGKSVLEAFDTIDILTKSARIFFTCRNAGYQPEGLTDHQLNEIKCKYHP
jgi:rhamnulose-1-phosphate aldolase